jgi:hypothetical protein
MGNLNCNAYIFWDYGHYRLRDADATFDEQHRRSLTENSSVHFT